MLVQHNQLLSSQYVQTAHTSSMVILLIALFKSNYSIAFIDYYFPSYQQSYQMVKMLLSWPKPNATE